MEDSPCSALTYWQIVQLQKWGGTRGQCSLTGLKLGQLHLEAEDFPFLLEQVYLQFFLLHHVVDLFCFLTFLCTLGL